MSWMTLPGLGSSPYAVDQPATLDPGEALPEFVGPLELFDLPFRLSSSRLDDSKSAISLINQHLIQRLGEVTGDHIAAIHFIH